MAITKYLLPSAPCKLTLRSGVRVNAPDGIVTVDSTDKQQAELATEMEAMLAVGNCSIYFDGDAVLPTQVAPSIQLGKPA